jgi:hypothetical protein
MPRRRSAGQASANATPQASAGADDVGAGAQRLLHRLAEHQAGGVARDARQRHQVLRADPHDRLVDPDHHRAGQPAGEARLHLLLQRGLGRVHVAGSAQATEVAEGLRGHVVSCFGAGLAPASLSLCRARHRLR